MQPINPFLRAFFRSALPSQCHPINNHILLVPTTDILVHSKDRDTNTYLADLAATEEFLASHVLRVTDTTPSGAKDYASAKGKAKQYTTINSRTVVIKDSFVYSNRGFKSLNQAQLLTDAIYYPDSADNQQWIVYYISKPLIGSIESVAMKPAILTHRAQREADERLLFTAGSVSLKEDPPKKVVKTFSELLNAFPLIGRYMQPGLERLFKDFADRFDRPEPQKFSRPPSVLSEDSSRSLEDSLASLRTSIRSRSSSLKNDASFQLDPEEQTMREALESCVTAAIELFQGVDKQHLTMVGATTNLSGPAVEGLLERYVAEQLHERVLFPAICRIKREDDLELESRIKRMLNIDIAQVGIAIEGGKAGKRDLALRLDGAVANFKRQGVAGGPHEMIDTLLTTVKIIATGSLEDSPNEKEAEKQRLAMIMNADTLVSMLLIVVIRSGIRHLHARLSYMKHFVFIDEVDTGETGYALSTLEAVLMYLGRSSEPMRRASRRNHQLWQAVLTGDVAGLQSMLEPDAPIPSTDQGATSSEVIVREEGLPQEQDGTRDSTTLSASQPPPSILTRTSSNGDDFAAVGGSLEHVFPFQRPPTPPPDAERPRRKRVSMAPAVRSASQSSTYSSVTHSRRASSNSVTSVTSAGLSADTSLATLAQTQNTQGDSLLMMAIEFGQIEVLQYLLELEDFFPLEDILEDCNTGGTTLLCAAIQSDRPEVTFALLDHIVERVVSRQQLEQYLARQDGKGRCVAHYLFHQPELLDDIGECLPWRLRDKNGQTPLFALCRSYDHPQYFPMVEKALALAAVAQPRRGRLHLDDHVDNKGNTLLHIVHNPDITRQLLKFADADVNAANEKKFTPFMVASKYGKMDLARELFADPRVELQCRDVRGLSAIELAKDDEIRNKIDDMVLLSQPSGRDGRITAVVRSMFVEDATVRVILKSAVVSNDGPVLVTTCRRGVRDFEFLAEWLNVEQPASWLPLQFNMASPFMIPSKPARAVLRDIQIRLDNFLRSLLTHSTFAHHEMVWEFFLIPDMDVNVLSERSRHKAEVRLENVRDEFEPVTDTREVEIFVGHAYDQVRKLSNSTRALIRRVNRQRQGLADLYELASFSSAAISTIHYLPPRHKEAFQRWAKTLAQPESAPMAAFYYSLHSIVSTSQALLAALNRPTQLVSSMAAVRNTLDRDLGSLSRQSRWTPNIGFFDETRRAIADEAQERADRTRSDLEGLGSELRYTQTTVAAELAGWQEVHVQEGRRMLRELARRMVVKEKERLEGMMRAVRCLQEV